MKALVLKPFKEKGKKRVYKPGQHIDVSKERMARINTHETLIVEAEPQKAGD